MRSEAESSVRIGGASLITETEPLVERGKKQGYVTYGDILEVQREAAEGLDTVEDLNARLMGEGVDVLGEGDSEQGEL